MRRNEQFDAEDKIRDLKASYRESIEKFIYSLQVLVTAIIGYLATNLQSLNAGGLSWLYIVALLFLSLSAYQGFRAIIFSGRSREQEIKAVAEANDISLQEAFEYPRVPLLRIRPKRGAELGKALHCHNQQIGALFLGITLYAIWAFLMSTTG